MNSTHHPAQFRLYPSIHPSRSIRLPYLLPAPAAAAKYLPTSYIQVPTTYIYPHTTSRYGTYSTTGNHHRKSQPLCKAAGTQQQQTDVDGGLLPYLIRPAYCHTHTSHPFSLAPIPLSQGFFLELVVVSGYPRFCPFKSQDFYAERRNTSLYHKLPPHPTPGTVKKVTGC